MYVLPPPYSKLPSDEALQPANQLQSRFCAEKLTNLQRAQPSHALMHSRRLTGACHAPYLAVRQSLKKSVCLQKPLSLCPGTASKPSPL